MLHAKRMVVVPETFLSSMQHQQNVQTSPLTQKLSSLDSDMDEILRNKELSDDVKLQRYNQILQRYLNFYSQRNDQPLQIKVESTLPREQEQEEIPQDENNIVEQEVIDTVPKTMKSKARLILNKMKSNKDIMHWNERGELIYHGKVIPSTHIVDLVRDVVKGRKSFDPNGWQFFSRGLARMNTPHDWIGNEQRKEVMRQYKSRMGEGISEDEGEPIRFLPTPPPSVLRTPQRSPRLRKINRPTLTRERWETL